MKSPSELIESLDVDGALQAWGDLPVESIEKPVLRHAYDKNDIRSYTLVTQLMLRDNRWEWQYLASMLLSQALSHLPGAYFSAYLHAEEACKLAPNNSSLKEYLLFFYIVPDRPMPDERAARIARELLASDPTNKAAIDTIKTFEKRQMARATHCP
jgi:hypothetical protein